MVSDQTHSTAGWRHAYARLWRPLLAAIASIALAGWSPTPPSAPMPASEAPRSVPAARKADSLAVITIRGEIDQWTAVSFERRLHKAEENGADAVVIELDTPGGEVGAVLRITKAIRASSILNTVAWVHPDAYSGGAIIALACREIVVSKNASMGDALAVTPDFQSGGLRTLTPDERTKLLPVMMRDVVESARRSGLDEYVAQAILVDGIELWLVEDTQTGRRWAVNEAEYRLLFEREPPRSSPPLLVGIQGGRYNASPEGPASAGHAPISESDPDTTTDDGAPADGVNEPGDPSDADPDAAPDAATPDDQDEPEEGETAFRPASPELDDIARAFRDESRRDSLAFDTPTNRPVFTANDRGRYAYVAYLTDGTAPAIMGRREMEALGFTRATVDDDTELLAFFGAVRLSRLDMSWSEKLARFMTHPLVRGVLIVILLLAVFLEMVSPGLVAPGTVALLALGALLAPPMIVGMAGWWELVAILAGFALLAAEVFVLPGFGVCGVLGLVSLFVGLVGTFIPDGGGPVGTAKDDGLLLGASTVLLSVITAAVGMYFIGRHIGSIPMLNRLVLDVSREEAADSAGSLLTLMASQHASGPAVGESGVTVTPLRPSGRAEIAGEIHDVVSGLGYVEPNTPVRVVQLDGFRVVVEPEADEREPRKPEPSDPEPSDPEPSA